MTQAEFNAFLVGMSVGATAPEPKAAAIALLAVKIRDRDNLEVNDAVILAFSTQEVRSAIDQAEAALKANAIVKDCEEKGN